MEGTGFLYLLTEDADSGTGIAAVLPGERGSADSAGAIAGTKVLRNPLYPRIDLEKRITEVINTEIWPHIWTWHQGTITWVDGDHIYDLPQYVQEVDLVYQVSLDGFRWHPIETGDWHVERQIDTTVATNSNMLRLRGVHYSASDVLYIGRRRPDVNDLANVSDEVAAVIPWGAAAAAMAARYGPLHNDPSQNPRTNERDMVRGYQLLRNEFEVKRDQLRRQLLNEVKRERRFVPRSRRGW